MSDLFVEVRRGNDVESLHRVHFVLCHADRGIVASAGRQDYVSFVRSAIKMFQALPLVEDGGLERFGLTPQELALCTASHGGEPFHVAAARAILRKTGVEEHALACGPHPPLHPGSAEILVAAGEPPGRIHNNCSGKHAGMLACATLHRWPIEGYHELAHPMQQRVVETLAHWTGVPADRMRVAIDGCGLPTFGLPLAAVALACARFAAAAATAEPVARDFPGLSDSRLLGAEGSPATAPARIIAAMTTHPEYVAGTDRLDTDLMRVTGGRVFAKVGAEGYYCAGAPAAGLGLALKVEDGAKRGSEPALLATLRAHDLVTDAELAALDQYARPPVLNTRGERVGEVRAVERVR